MKEKMKYTKIKQKIIIVDKIMTYTKVKRADDRVARWTEQIKRGQGGKCEKGP